MTFGEKLKNIRRAKNLTQNQIATILNLDQTNISNWERNKNLPSPPILVKLASILDVSIDYLLSEDEDMPKTHVIPVVSHSKGNKIPKQMVEITDEQYNALLAIIKQADKNRKN